MINVFFIHPPQKCGSAVWAFWPQSWRNFRCRWKQQLVINWKRRKNKERQTPGPGKQNWAKSLSIKPWVSHGQLEINGIHATSRCSETLDILFRNYYQQTNWIITVATVKRVSHSFWDRWISSARRGVVHEAVRYPCLLLTVSGMNLYTALLLACTQVGVLFILTPPCTYCPLNATAEPKIK